MPNDQAAATPLASSAPPEPPTRPFSGPVFEQDGQKFHCKVPGCSGAETAFAGRQGITVHVIRRHGLTLDGKVYNGGTKARAPVPPVAPPAPDPRTADLRGLVVGTDLALVTQTVKMLERTRDNLSGRLSEMDSLRLKAAKLDLIVERLKWLLQWGGQP